MPTRSNRQRTTPAPAATEAEQHRAQSAVQSEELRQAQHALTQAQNRDAALYDDAPVGYVTLDRLGLILKINLACARLLDTESAVILNQPFDSLIHPDDLPLFQAHLRKAASSTGPTSTDVRLRKQSGQSWHAQLITAPSAESDRPAGTLWTAVIDITERKQAEDALSISRELLSAIFRFNPIGICLARTTDGHIIVANPALLSLCGYSQDELFGQSMLSANLWVQPDEVARLMRLALAHHRVQDVELQLRHKSGEVRVALIAAEVVETVGQQYLLMALYDITERKRSEMALRDSDARFSAAFSLSPLLLGITTQAGRYVEVNQAFCDLTGLPREAIIGKTIAELGLISEAERLNLAAEMAAAGGTVDNREFQFSLRDGRTRDILFSIKPFIFQGVYHHLGAGLDITLRKHTEAILRESEERFRSFFENAVEGMLLTQPDGRILAANLAACQMFGLTEAELLASRREAVMDATDPRLSTLLATRRATGRAHGELTGLRRDGTKFPVEATSAIYHDSMGNLKASIILRDITERARADEALRRYHEELEASGERLHTLSRQLLAVQEAERRLIARALHDEIGQALTAVKLDMQAVRDQHSPAGAKALTESVDTLDWAMQAIRNLSLDLRPSLLDDLGLPAALRWYADRQAQRAGFTAQVRTSGLATRLPPDIETICFRVTQEALTNIVRHAAAQRVQIEVRHHDSQVDLHITDDGCGFDVEAARRRAVHGDSLGLLSMDERVHLGGGEIAIESVPDHGTTIRVRLPLGAANPIAPPDSPEPDR